MKKYDGCSGYMSAAWKLLFKNAPPWEQDCDEHDQWYADGGTALDRETADQVLMASVTLRGYPILGFLMWLAVRIGGHPIFPLPWRWGFKQDYLKILRNYYR